jgi:dimethylglycine dehydrogenase
VTSGAYAHYSRASLALGYVPTALADGPDDAPFEIEIIGRRRPARIQRGPILDPEGRRMRG